MTKQIKETDTTKPRATTTYGTKLYVLGETSKDFVMVEVISKAGNFITVVNVNELIFDK